jgi:AcrR family transcriptional regulator
MTADDPARERQTRNSERTRSAVLAAAAAAMADRGTAVSLAYIAQQAGVSKGGLLHHFATRDQLILALVEDANERFRDVVTGYLDLSENTPGKMLRAYVRALCSGSDATAQYFNSAPTWNGVHLIPAVAEVMAADAAWWEEQFALDGLSANRILVVRRAAEGMAAAVAYGEADGQAALNARDLFLDLTLGGELGD